MNAKVIWDTLSKVVICLLFVAGLLAVVFWYLPLIQENQRYRREILHLEAKIAEQERVARSLRATIDSLQHDPRALERLAREKLGWVRTNEMVVRFDPPPARSQAGPGR